MLLRNLVITGWLCNVVQCWGVFSGSHCCHELLLLFVFSASHSDVLASLNALRFLIQGALYNELKDISAAEKVWNSALQFATLVNTLVPSVLWHYWLGIRKSIQPVKIEVWLVVLLSVWSKVHIVCIWSSWRHCHPKTPSSLASFKSGLVLPFWYRPTQVVLEKRPLNGCSSTVTKGSTVYYSSKCNGVFFIVWHWNTCSALAQITSDYLH